MTVVMNGDFDPPIEHEKISGAGVPARHAARTDWKACVPPEENRIVAATGRPMALNFPEKTSGDRKMPGAIGSAPRPVRWGWTPAGLTE
jgi:hypothetical protein